MIKVKVLKAQTLGKINEINLDLVTSVNNEYIVGRSPQSGLILDSSDVSRMHGKFFVQNGNYYYSDLGSVNGSLVNDKLAEINQIYQLKSRDVIRIGEFLLVIEEVGSEPEAMPVTVFNADWRRASLKVDPPVITNQYSEPVSEVPTPVEQHLEPVSEVPTPAEQPLEPVIKVPTPAEQPLEPVSEVPTPPVVTNESEQLIPVDEELIQSPDLTIIQTPKEAIGSEINLQTQEAIAETEVVKAPEVDTPLLSDIYESEPTVIQGEVTIIQLPEEVVTEANTSTPSAIGETGVLETREIDSEIPSNTNESEATIIQGEVTSPQQVATEENTLTPVAIASLNQIETREIDTPVPSDTHEEEATVIHDELTVIQIPQQVATEENTLTPVAIASLNQIETREIDTPVPSDTHEEEATVIHDEVTVIQLPQQVATEENILTPVAIASLDQLETREIDTPVPSDTHEEEATVIHDEVTVIQLPQQVATEENILTPVAIASLDQLETREIDTPVPSDTHEQEAIVIHDEVTVIQIPEFVETEEISAQTEEALHSKEVQASENNTHTPLDINEVLEEIEASTVIPETTTFSTEVVEVSPVLDEVPHTDQPITDTVSQTTMKSPESVTQTPEEVSQDMTQASNEAEMSEVMAQTPETVNKAFEIIGKKYIALMTHDSKKSELVQFVTQHQDFLLKCLTIATPSISETLSQQTRLTTSQKTPSVPVGGYQAVASLIGTGDVLAVILLKDFLAPASNQANEEALLRLCNINQILVATNLTTADAVIHYIKDMVTSL
ncbi:MAG: FHA domain-containing protein [Rhizonema sp. NSF051]|nr:FHA domain-containing protein [Rhizonema sp. NSF051]